MQKLNKVLNRNLFIKVETNLIETQEIIDNVSIELIYLIDTSINLYNYTFDLYDNGTNGDIIKSNGI